MGKMARRILAGGVALLALGAAGMASGKERATRRKKKKER
jgi:hypothetical protein